MSSGQAESRKLVLYVAGQTPKSLAAIANLERICREHLDGQYSVEVVDLKKAPHLAREHGIVAIPTLVRQLPVPIRNIDAYRRLVEADMDGQFPRDFVLQNVLDIHLPGSEYERNFRKPSDGPT